MATNNTYTKAQVKDIQRALNEQGANLKVDGIFGAKTASAYSQFIAKATGNTSTANKAPATTSQTGIRSGTSSPSYSVGSYAPEPPKPAVTTYIPNTQGRTFHVTSMDDLNLPGQKKSGATGYNQTGVAKSTTGNAMQNLNNANYLTGKSDLNPFQKKGMEQLLDLNFCMSYDDLNADILHTMQYNGVETAYDQFIGDGRKAA